MQASLPPPSRAGSASMPLGYDRELWPPRDRGLQAGLERRWELAGADPRRRESQLGRCPDALPPAELGDHSYFGFFATDDVDALQEELAARGARILSAPADTPWGWREMPVATP